MNAATLPPFPSARIPSDPIAAERELEARYLGDDMEQICSVAVATNDSVLIANAALPLKNRRAAFLNWRKKQVRGFLQRDPDFRLFHDEAAPALRESINEGEIPLVELTAQVFSYRLALDSRRIAARSKSKAALRMSLLSAMQDCDETKIGFKLPGFLAILESGEVGLFHKRRACIEWARASGVAYLLGNFEPNTFKLHHGPPVD